MEVRVDPGRHRSRPRRQRAARAVTVVIVVLLVDVAIGAAAGATSGIDVSRWQHPYGAAIDWAQVRAAGHRFAFIKATDPVDGTNPYFASDWSGAAGAGLYRGAYHRARPASSTPEQQASQFVAVAGSHGGAADLPPVLDLEETGGLAPAALVDWTRRWLQTVTTLTGRRPTLYTGYYFWKDQLGATTTLSGYRLWLPQYTTQAQPYLVPEAWSMWTFWQHSNTGTVPGITGPVDLNRYCCGDGNLAAMAGSSAGEAAGNPFGVLDTTTGGPGSLTVTGWGLDPDTTAPIGVHVYVDGRFGAAVTAGGPRPDVGAAYPGFGSGHGFTASITGVGGGDRTVCAYGLNTGAGTANTLLGCRVVRVPTGSPVGTVDEARHGPGFVDVRGWAIDPDTAAAIDVHLYVDGRPAGAVTANGNRPDVGAFFTAYGPAHGFTARVPAPIGGTHTVCAYGINTGAGTNALLGCRSAAAPGGNPFGVLDEVSAGPGGIRTRGWVIDPDTTAPTTVHVYIDNRAVAAVSASGSRPDVGAAYPDHGSAHGFDATHAATPGPHTVCVYAINLASGTTNPNLGCRAVTTP